MGPKENSSLKLQTKVFNMADSFCQHIIAYVTAIDKSIHSLPPYL